MAKRQRNQQVRASFHYLVKSFPNEDDPENPIEEGFSEEEFERVVNRISNTTALDDTNEEVVAAIKVGSTLPFLAYAEIEPGLHFGDFEGAYYGQRFRNNRVGEIAADDLNLRRFHYLITRLRDGKIIVGVSYHGQFGAYGDMQGFLTHLLCGEHRVASKTLRSLQAEIGEGYPVSLKLSYRKRANRDERRSLFGTSGVIAIKSSDFGDGFEDRVQEVAGRIRGNDSQRKRAIADIVNEAEMLELDEDDIVGCSAVVRRNGRRTTVYFLGENNFSTKYPLAVEMDRDGMVDPMRMQAEMVRVLRNEILPILV